MAIPFALYSRTPRDVLAYQLADQDLPAARRIPGLEKASTGDYVVLNFGELVLVNQVLFENDFVRKA